MTPTLPDTAALRILAKAFQLATDRAAASRRGRACRTTSRRHLDQRVVGRAHGLQLRPRARPPPPARRSATPAKARRHAAGVAGRGRPRSPQVGPARAPASGRPGRSPQRHFQAAILGTDAAQRVGRWPPARRAARRVLPVGPGADQPPLSGAGPLSTATQRRGPRREAPPPSSCARTRSARGAPPFPAASAPRSCVC